jgi:outer membrane protein assembly factor BamA
VGYFGEIESYINGNPDFPNQDAGTNDSNRHNFISGEGFDNFFRTRLHYLLPTGHGREQVVPRYDVVDGLPVGGFTGARSLNPLESGRAFVDFRLFYRSQEITGDDVSSTISTNGVDLGLTWDNRDFPPNPARGQSVTLGLSRDFGAFNSSSSWTVRQAEVDQYFELNNVPYVRQAVLALDAWTAGTPSWEQRADGSVANRPPAYAGATLGGLWRMRAYPAQRFNDRAAMYYAAELRVIPEWNPFDAWPGFQSYANVEWLQFVPFVELGRVAPEWNWRTLHSSMRWSAGFGIRAWASGFVVRVDTALSEEGAGVQMMISQPFQFF